MRVSHLAGERLSICSPGRGWHLGALISASSRTVASWEASLAQSSPTKASAHGTCWVHEVLPGGAAPACGSFHPSLEGFQTSSEHTLDTPQLWPLATQFPLLSEVLRRSFHCLLYIMHLWKAGAPDTLGCSSYKGIHVTASGAPTHLDTEALGRWMGKLFWGDALL